MPQPRSSLIDLDASPYVHCISRCVRQAFLCGYDLKDDLDFSHRRQWVVERLSFLSAIFAIDVCAFAALSNHLHSVLFVDRDRARTFSDEEVIGRWTRLFPSAGKNASKLRGKRRRGRCRTLRKQLFSVSWFQRCLNEHIARAANKEEGRMGRFWEGRFRSQTLLDEGALLTCMAYVDLNPLRAGLADTLEGSDFTSIQQRLWEMAEALGNKAALDVFPARMASLRTDTFPALVPFADAEKNPDIPSHANPLPIDGASYVQLVTEAGRQLRAGKWGCLSPASEETLLRLGLDANNWLGMLKNYSSVFFTMVGEVHKIDLQRRRRGQSRVRGVPAAQRLYLETG